MPEEQLERHGIDPEETNTIVEALGRGELDTAYDLTTPEIAETLSIAGTPEECVARIKDIAIKPFHGLVSQDLPHRQLV